jgi:hypothetical protein
MPHYPLPTNKKKGEFNSLGNLNYMYQPVGVFIFLGFSVLAKFATWQSVLELELPHGHIEGLFIQLHGGKICRFFF